MRHCLFIMRAECRQYIARCIKRFAYPSDISMSKDGPHTAEEWMNGILIFRFLRSHRAHQGLRHCEADR